MKAKIMGFDEFTKERFSYELENVVGVLQVMDMITIQYISDGKPTTSTYYKDQVKIVIEN